MVTGKTHSVTVKVINMLKKRIRAIMWLIRFDQHNDDSRQSADANSIHFTAPICANSLASSVYVLLWHQICRITCREEATVVIFYLLISRCVCRKLTFKADASDTI